LSRLAHYWVRCLFSPDQTKLYDRQLVQEIGLPLSCVCRVFSRNIQVKKAQAMSRKPQTIDEYLARLSPDKRAALQKLRRAIKSAAPKAEECISYGIPAFRLDGRMLVAFGAATNHCSFYPGAAPVRIHKAALKAYRTSKGTVRFPADHPLPATLVRKLVKTRVAEHAARRPEATTPAKRRSSS
jgi:uncharacterized protein YdhG (YjbR/CyaY superfamily)